MKKVEGDDDDDDDGDIGRESASTSSPVGRMIRMKPIWKVT